MTHKKRFEIVKFILSGGISLFTLLSLLFVFHKKIGIGIIPASTIAYGASFIVGFLFQKYWTFGETRKDFVIKQLLMYGLIALGNTGANAILMHVFSITLGVWYLTSQFIVAGIISVWSYFLYKRFVFLKYVEENTLQE